MGIHLEPDVSYASRAHVQQVCTLKSACLDHINDQGLANESFYWSASIDIQSTDHYFASKILLLLADHARSDIAYNLQEIEK